MKNQLTRNAIKHFVPNKLLKLKIFRIDLQRRLLKRHMKTKKMDTMSEKKNSHQHGHDQLHSLNRQCPNQEIPHLFIHHRLALEIRNLYRPVLGWLSALSLIP